MSPMKNVRLSVLSVLYLICACKTENCPDGWVRFHESCYFFADEHGLDWTEAQNFCQQHSHSYLVNVESVAENTLLVDYAHRLFKAGNLNSKFWMGGSDDETEGLWVWVPTHKLMSEGYTHWAHGEPGNGLPIEYCLCLHPPVFEWHDCYCYEKNHPLCEKNTTTDSIAEVIG